MELKVDVLPKNAWYSNVRTMVSPTQWKNIRNYVYEKYGDKCAICGAEKGKDCGRLAAHELWEFEILGAEQKLVGIIAVCDNCHSCIHFGRSTMLTMKLGIDFYNNLVSHYMKVNNCSKEKLDYDVMFSVENAKVLDEYVDKWHLNLEYLKEIGFEDAYNYAVKKTEDI